MSVPPPPPLRSSATHLSGPPAPPPPPPPVRSPETHLTGGPSPPPPPPVRSPETHLTGGAAPPPPPPPPVRSPDTHITVAGGGPPPPPPPPPLPGSGPPPPPPVRKSSISKKKEPKSNPSASRGDIFAELMARVPLMRPGSEFGDQSLRPDSSFRPDSFALSPPPVMSPPPPSKPPPPPPPVTASPLHSSHPPPPIPQHSPQRKSQVGVTPPPPPVRSPSHFPMPTSPSGIPPPPVLRSGKSPPSSEAPPPPPVRKDSVKRYSSGSSGPPTPARKPSRKSAASSESPPPPPPRREDALVAAGHGNASIPPPPALQRLSSGGGTPPSLVPPPVPASSTRYNHLTAITNGVEVEDNRPGYGDYDIPRSVREDDGTQDYDMPLTKKEREAKERALGILPPEPSGAALPAKAERLLDRPGSDYDIPITKEERERRQKASLLPPSSVSESLSLSGDSRPLSVASSVYSSDASSVSSSSQSGTKTAVSKDEEPEYARVNKPSASGRLKPQSSLEEQISALDQLVVEISEEGFKKSSDEEAPEGQKFGKMLSSARSSYSENDSSRSGSNDNLGVWDDVSYEEEESESTGEEEGGGGEGVVMAPVGDVEHRGSKEEVLLDNWIMELESGMKGMAEVAGMDLSEVESLPTLPIASFDDVPPAPPSPPSLSGPPPVPPPLPPVEVEELGLPPPPDFAPAPPPVAPPPPVPVAPPTQTQEPTKRKDSRSESNIMRKRKTKTQKEMAQIASWRLSMKVLEDAEDPDLDALLADLCKLEEDTKAQLASSNSTAALGGGGDQTLHAESPTKMMGRSTAGESKGVSSDDFILFMEGLQQSSNLIVDPSKGVSMATYSSESRSTRSVEPPDVSEDGKSESSPARDDIFSEVHIMQRHNSRTSAMLARKDSRKGKLSRNVTESTVSDAHDQIQKQLDAFAEQLTVDESLTPVQQAQRLKGEKLKIAMMKLKEASVQKMVLKVHNVDGSTKMVAIHDGMNARDVCFLLAERNHKELGPNWTLVERLPDLHLEHTMEDHELVLEKLSHWPRNHNNNVLFKNNPEKYYLLQRPQLLMPASHAYASVNPSRTPFTEEQKKNIILKELFKTNVLPKLEGELHIRDGKRSSWKKQLFVFRASGLYYSKAGKSLSSRDIVRVVEWKDVRCYSGNQYKKFYRAPGHHCFSLAPNGPLNKIEKQIIHLCVPTRHDLVAWMTAIRLAKHGERLQKDYEDTKAELPWLQLEDDNLDQAMAKPATSRKSRTPETAPPTIVVQNGRELSPADLSAKRKISNLRGSFQFKSSADSNGTVRSGERETLSISASHVITGPMETQASTSLRRNRSGHSLLASAFQNAWKQGTLVSEMGPDTEKWPVFNQPKRGSSLPRESLKEKPSLPYEEENSGMFTLKRKGKKKEAESEDSPPPLPIPRAASLSMDRRSVQSEHSSRASQISMKTNYW